MNESTTNPYKACRQCAGFTQEKAAEKLNLSTRCLQGYEAEDDAKYRTPVPDDTVDAMVQLYNTPLLALWHIKKNSPLGKYLPDVQDPQSPGDMGFQAILAKDDATEADEIIRRVLADGKIEPDEHGDLKKFSNAAKIAAGKLLSASMYADKELQKKSPRSTAIETGAA